MTEITDAITLPPNEDENEWIAFHIYFFTKQLQELVTQVIDQCSCETMLINGVTYPYNKQEIPARQFIENTMHEANVQLQNEDMFPLEITANYQPKFKQVVKGLSLRLLKVYAHLQEHNHEMKDKQAIIGNLRHFIAFMQKYQLLNDVDLDSVQHLQKYIELK